MPRRRPLSRPRAVEWSGSWGLPRRIRHAPAARAAATHAWQRDRDVQAARRGRAQVPRARLLIVARDRVAAATAVLATITIGACIVVVARPGDIRDRRVHAPLARDARVGRAGLVVVAIDRAGWQAPAVHATVTGGARVAVVAGA